MIVKWHSDKKTHMNKSCLVTIRTGETQAIANWRTGLSAQNKLDQWDEAWEMIEQVCSAGKDLIANDPIVERFSVGDKQLAVVFGIISDQVSPRGRVFGEYRFVMCMADEVLLVLAKCFGIEKRLRRRAG